MQPNYQPFATRRHMLARQLKPGVIILPTSPEVARNADAHFPFRFDSSFYYLTAFPEPEAVFVQIILDDKVENLLFCRAKNEEREIWDGYRYGPAAAAETFGFDAAYPIDELDTRLADILKNQPRIYFPFGQDAGWDRRLAGWLDAVRAQVRAGVRAPAEIVDIRSTLHEMRLIKDAHEIAVLRHAGRINATAHIRAMRAVRPGMVEYEIEAEFLHEFCRHGSRFPAYGSIVASGANACVLHYVENNCRMQDGDLLLIDAGCELEGYASDITRTFPVNGKFSGPQKDVYEITLAAHQAAFDLARPGIAWHEIHDAATRVLAQGMLDLGLLQGTLDGVLESGSYKQFYMHRTGHWLGLDVHDVGEYKIGDDWRRLEPGMVFTIEPGFYIRPAANVPKHLENIGVRIEDDVLITADGHENLTALCPRTVADIEAAMAAR